MGFLMSILKLAVVVGLIVFGGLYLFQHRLIFYPSTLPLDFKFSFAHPSEEKWLDIGGRRFHNLYFDVKHSPGVIIYFHGNAQSLEQWGQVASDLVERTGWSVWVTDYPGYGKSPGPVPTEAELYGMGEKVFNEVKKLAPSKRILIYGRSLGSVVAVDVASHHDVDGLILETPLYDAVSMARKIMPKFPDVILKYHFLSHQKINHIAAPILFIHGSADMLVPLAHGRKLYDVFQGPKEFLEISGGGHNDLYRSDLFWPEIEKFLKKVSSRRLSGL